jgi:uncharacterized membrane protein
MTALLTNLRTAVLAGFALAAALSLLYVGAASGVIDRMFWAFVFRWLHVISGIMWIGLLWYFNFVQIPTMPKIPDELKPALGRFIGPAALFWFRWAAMATLATGLVLAYLNNYLLAAYSLGATEDFALPGHISIGIGMWLATIMWFNVWFVIWPNQQRALNIDNKFPNLAADQKAKHARLAMLFSRTNTILSIPMLFAMVSAQGLYHLS